jgi:hypothetical protein
MTAATWEQARKFMECDCMHADRVTCATSQGLNYETCSCQCHSYTIIEVIERAVRKGVQN